MQRHFFDCESFLLSPGCQTPPMVCLQVKTDNQPTKLFHAADPQLRVWLDWTLRRDYFVGHHVSYDMAVICAQWPELTPVVFDAYEQNRVTDTQCRQKLIDIAQGRLRGEKKPQYDLGSCSERAGGPVLDKNDPWRLRYGTLYDVPLALWPQEAVTYAVNDAEATSAVWHAQQKYAHWLEDEHRQARADFWITLMIAWGFATDREAAERYIAKVQATLAEDRALCEQMGLVRPDGTKNTKAAQAWMVQLCATEGEEVPLTEGGKPSLSEESIEEHGDYVLEAYQRYANANTRAKRARRLLNSPIQARFDVLQNTGRMSCSQGDNKVKKSDPWWKHAVSAYGSQIQNPSRDAGYREVFCARPGYALVSIDYGALELCCFAAVCLEMFGFSAMANSINAGGDQHTELAAKLIGVSKEEAYRLKASDKNFANGPRFFAKAGNFGFLGGMGPVKFCRTLVKQAVHSGNAALIAKAKAYTEDEARELKAAFVEQWPESKLYFKHWGDLIRFEGEGPDDFKTIRVRDLKSGRVRGGCSYSQACNDPFQGRAANLFKDAMWRIAKEMYVVCSSPLFGSRTVNAIHDQGLFEIPLDCLHEAAYRASHLMVSTAEEWCPGVKFLAEPAAMLSWTKNDRTVHDSNGRLIPLEWAT